MANEQKENVTTILNMAPADAISDRDVLYLLQGSGSDRDRRATLAEIFRTLGNKVLAYAADDKADYLVNKLLQGDVIYFSSSTTADGRNGLVANLRDNGVTTDKLADGAVTRAKLGEDLKPALLPFQNDQRGDLNGKSLNVDAPASGSSSYLGNIGNPATGRLVDFTLQADFWPQGQVETWGTVEFYITVWHGSGGITEDKTYEKRLVTLSMEGARKIRERFTFVTAADDNIKLSITGKETYDYSGFILSNAQLHGFVL